MEDNVNKTSSLHVGIPTMALLPPRNYKFEVFEERYKLKVPIQGTLHDLDPDFFDEDSGDFLLYDDQDKVLNVSILTKILFAAKQYPAIQDNQFFCPIVFILKDGFLEIIGQVVNMLPMEDSEEVSDV